MVSVCIAAYNGEKYIREQLNSILFQLEKDDEVIISDDGSTDKTIEIIDSFNDPRIKVYYHKDKVKTQYKFNYVSQNFQNALIHAKGDFIFLSDQDDVWKLKKVSVCKSYLESSDLVLHDCEIISAKGKLIDSSYFEINKSKKGILKNLISNSYLGCCMAFNKKTLQKSLPFPKDIPHDVWIGLIAEMYGKVAFVNDKYISYRRHGYNASPSGEKSKNSLLFKLQYRLIILKSLVFKFFGVNNKFYDENSSIR